MEFAELIGEALRRTERPVAALGRELGVARSTINRTVHGDVCMRESELRGLARLLSLDEDEVVIAASATAKPGTTRARIGELLRENRALRLENARLQCEGTMQ